MAFFYDSMKYIEYNSQNPRCIHCFISERAYASVITEVMANGQNETGGVFLGYIVNRGWYIVESVDPGINTVNQVSFFQWDEQYVNHQAERLSKIYSKPLTILGFWHRHPKSMDYFSGQDESTIRSDLKQLRQGLLSMLVNIDPKLRMTYYYCYGNEIMPIRYDVGDKYFPAELMKYADAAELTERAALRGRVFEIYYEQVLDLDAIAARKKVANESNKTFSEKKREMPATSYDSNIKRGIEDNRSDSVKILSEKVDSLEKNIELLSGKIEEIFAKISSVETNVVQTLSSPALIAAVTKSDTESMAKEEFESRQVFNAENDAMKLEEVGSEKVESEEAAPEEAKLKGIEIEVNGEKSGEIETGKLDVVGVESDSNSNEE